MDGKRIAAARKAKGWSQEKLGQMMGHALPGVTGEHYDKPTAAAFVETVAAAFSCKPFGGR